MYLGEKVTDKGYKIEISEAKDSDFEEIEKIVVSVKLPVDSFKNYERMLIAKYKDKMIGCVGMERRENRVYLESLAVLKSYQKYGVSIPLLNGIFDFMNEGDRLIAYSMFWNNNYYKHIGFKRLDPKIKQADDIGKKEKHKKCTAYGITEPIVAEKAREEAKDAPIEKKPSEEKKLKWPIEKLYPWAKNPRGISIEGMDRLKKQLRELGEYKPLLITEEGEVIGGNMRLSAMKEIISAKAKEDEDFMKKNPDAFKSAWVSIVYPESEEEKVKYALSDNDRAGYYVEQELGELVDGLNLNLEDFKVDLGEPVDLSTIIGNLKISEDEFGDDMHEGVDVDFAPGVVTAYFRLGDLYCEVDEELYLKLKERFGQDPIELLKKISDE
jgi:N-acetylglutamate synthase-like GNAT family acetyltransferase